MANKNSLGWGKWVLLLVLIGAGYGGYFLYSQNRSEAKVDFKSVVAARGDVIQSVTANGGLTPVRNVEVGSQISGTLLDVKVDFNDQVKTGDILAQIDPATYERALVQAEAELANTAAAQELSQLNFARAKDLFGNKLISKSEYDEARASLSQAEANVRTRQANVDRAKVDLSRTTIYAPIDGMILTRKIEVGNTVAASLNSPTLFIIANDLRKMRIEAAVSEADVGGVAEGQTVNFTVDAFPARKFSGVIQQVRFAANTNQNVISYTTIVEVNNSDLKLRPGMTANASIIIAEKKGVMRVPNAALRFRPPEGAVVQSNTNAPTASAPQVELATSGPFAGLPVPPWQKGGERRRPTDEERAAFEASLTPEQKEKYQQAMAEMRARFAGGGGGSGGAGGSERPRRAEPEGPRSQTIYLLEKDASATGGTAQVVLKPVTVKLGISDGSHTEVVEGLKEGDVVVTGTITQTAAAPQPSGGPLGGSPFGGGRRPR